MAVTREITGDCRVPVYERPHTLTPVYTQRVYDVYTDIEGYDGRDGTYFKVWRVSSWGYQGICPVVQHV